LPVLTMAGLYTYAAIGTVGPAVAKQDSATVNADVGAADAFLGQAIETEEADTFIYQASDHRAIPDSKLTAPGTGDYAKTDAAIAAFRSGAAKARGSLSAAAAGVLPSVYAALGERTKLRAEVQAGNPNGLDVFEGYLDAEKPYVAFSITLANPNETVQLFDESEGLIDAGDGTADLADVGILLGGVLAGGDYMTPQEYQLFEQLYNNQQLEFSAIDDPVLWQVSPDPYWTSVDGAPPAMSSPVIKTALALEQEVLTDGSNRATVRLPLTPAQVQDAIEAALSPTGPLLTAENIGRIGITAGDNHQGGVILWRLSIVGGVGLLVVILSTFLLLRFGRRIARELRGLRNAAWTLSGERLPSVVRRLRAGDDVDVAAEAPPLDLRTRTREVGDTADAFSAVQHTAIEAAVEQAQLRKGVSNVFRSLARRNQSLVQRQLRMLDEMERGTQDPDALAQLFRLDHLTTRMRRQAEGLIILSGAAPGRRWRQPVSVVEVLRGAISEIEDYVRVDLLTESPDYLTGAAVADVTHLLAELVENAVAYSPPGTRVQVSGGRVANGYVVEVDDRGLGIPAGIRDKLNERLAQPVEFDLADSDQLGLFVVSRLAVRNGIKVSLRESGFGGTTAIVLLPAALVVSEQEAAMLSAEGGRGAAASAEGTFTARRAPRLDRPAGVQDVQQDPSGEQPSGSRPSRPTRGGGRGSFGNPAPFQDAPAPSLASSPRAAAGPSARSSSDAGDGGGQSVGVASGGLPKRERMASLAPQLRDNRQEPQKEPLSGRSPEQARALLSSIQRGLQTGREAGSAPDSTGDGTAGGAGNETDDGGA
jgi:signal transduction histidine kinase